LSIQDNVYSLRILTCSILLLQGHLNLYFHFAQSGLDYVFIFKKSLILFLTKQIYNKLKDDDRELAINVKIFILIFKKWWALVERLLYFYFSAQARLWFLSHSTLIIYSYSLSSRWTYLVHWIFNIVKYLMI